MIQIFKFNILFIAFTLVSSCTSEDINSEDSTTPISDTPVFGAVPKGIAFDDNDNLLISLSNASVVKLSNNTISNIFTYGDIDRGFGHNIRYKNKQIYVLSLKNVTTIPDRTFIQEILQYSESGEYINTLISVLDTDVFMFNDFVISNNNLMYVSQFPHPDDVLTFKKHVIRFDTITNNVVDIFIEDGITSNMTISSYDELYMNKNVDVIRLDINGDYVATLARKNENGLVLARLLTVDIYNNLYILNTDTESKWSVLKYDENGAFLGEIISSNDIDIESIDDIAVDSQGNIYIAAFDLYMFDSQGIFVKKVADSF